MFSQGNCSQHFFLLLKRWAIFQYQYHEIKFNTTKKKFLGTESTTYVYGSNIVTSVDMSIQVNIYLPTFK